MTAPIATVAVTGPDGKSVTVRVYPADPSGNFAASVNNIFAGPLPGNPVDATGGFTGTPADQTKLPNVMGINHDTLEEAIAIAEPRNALGGQLFHVIRSDATDKPRFQLIGNNLAFPDDWKIVWTGTAGTAPATNVVSGVVNVWSQDQADNQGQNPGDAERNRPPVSVPEGPST